MKVIMDLSPKVTLNKQADGTAFILQARAALSGECNYYFHRVAHDKRDIAELLLVQMQHIEYWLR